MLVSWESYLVNDSGRMETIHGLIGVEISVLPVLGDGTSGLVEPCLVFRKSGNFHGRKKLVTVGGGFSQRFKQSDF